MINYCISYIPNIIGNYLVSYYLYHIGIQLDLINSKYRWLIQSNYVFILYKNS